MNNMSDREYDPIIKMLEQQTLASSLSDTQLAKGVLEIWAEIGIDTLQSAILFELLDRFMEGKDFPVDDT